MHRVHCRVFAGATPVEEKKRIGVKKQDDKIALFNDRQVLKRHSAEIAATFSPGS